MQILLQSKLLEITQPIRDYIDRRFEPLSKLLKRFEEKGECVLRVEIARSTRHHRKGEVYYVEATLALQRKTIRIEENNEDLRAGIDAAKKRLMVAIEEYKERSEEKRK